MGDIRTYNILQDRVTDHRVKKSWFNIEKIMAGDGLADIVEYLAKTDCKVQEGEAEEDSE